MLAMLRIAILSFQLTNYHNCVTVRGAGETIGRDGMGALQCTGPVDDVPGSPIDDGVYLGLTDDLRLTTWIE